ncbi:MAG TPA: ATPase, T2SS/T4P/T4SS family [Gemmatimonadaceae bacterium]|jgi:type II secretory ATPase GspE/PulE/Tfp pilus assembly ATPase PilB-like protein/8-oxo-dGTP pyrophosphatase MutT (NUDIX family)|nr:ATPase, T2SS/T4P/T4SS family [Gemmatimonadaceae bacterium]
MSRSAIERSRASRLQAVQWRVARNLLPAPQAVDVSSLARRFRLPIADLSRASAHAVGIVPEKWARRFHVLPLSATEHEILIATADPLDVDCERTLGFATGRHVRLAVADADEIGRRIDELYRAESPTGEPERALEVQHLGRDVEGAPLTPGDDGGASISALVDELLAAGIASRASDIHIEAEEQGIAVRHRVDGVLAVVRHLPRSVGPALVSRIKILSGLDIADRLRPQDGRARIAVNGVAVDLRVSTLPASHGEKVVIRVLDGRGAIVTLDGMGFHPDELMRIERLLESREGLILVTGPTGSGKTTTLYAALRQIKERGVNIVTVEDPIEYRLPGIVQVQVNEKAGMTFAAALRSIMRQDPDVVLIGEIRDRETAEIAIQASLTGHLVLSTLHTNDAPSAVTRLIDIGVAGYKIATAVKGVVAQRLVRRSCGECNGTDAACPVCSGSGFHGRLAIVEVLTGSPEFEKRVAAGESTERIAEAARQDGMRSLWQSGVAHAMAGRTTLDEVRRVASPDDEQKVVAEHEPQRFGPSFDAFDRDPVQRVRDDLEAVLARAAALRSRLQPMTSIEVGTVDVFVVRPLPEGWRVLALQRGRATRCPTAWEPVHGHIEPGETPEQAAIRELHEEAGVAPDRLYVVRVSPFYIRRTGTLELAVVFAAFVDRDADVTIGEEHERYEWLTVDEALTRFAFPGERASLREVVELLSSGDAGPVDDVMRVL